MLRRLRPALAGLLLLLAGCAGGFEAVEHTPASEMRPGPGLFSGEAGEFVIYRR